MKIITSLHTNTEYSFQESTIKIDSLIVFAKKNNIDTLTITDHNNMFGVFEFYKKCLANDIKPIIGLDLDVENHRLILLSKNYHGFKHLCHLSSKKMKNKNINLEEINADNIFIIDHPTKGFYAKTKKELKMKNFFIATDDNLSNAVFVKETKLLNDADNESLSILESSLNNYGKIIFKKYSPYICEVDDSKINVQNTIEIIKNCNLEIPKNKNYLPKFKNNENISSDEYLEKILTNNFSNYLFENKDKYKERMKFEISIIKKLGFSDYFLIIWDLIKWAKKNQIIIGPGRGSSAGSLVAYILEITEIDPLKYGLLFERFLNPNRISMPDIDIDIQDNRRDEVIKYIYNKYGNENVAHITTFSRLGAKSAIRDVARLLNIPQNYVNDISKLIPNDSTLKNIYNQSSKFRALMNINENNMQLFKWASAIEGLPRQIGTHAAGIIISEIPIEENFPTLNNSEEINQIQYSMDFLEENGLLKIDLLGLKNLTIINDIQNEILINQNKKIDLKKIPNSDYKTNLLLSNGETNGIFQLESYGMKSTLEQVKVSSLNDITAIISLYRPGPMDSIKIYAARKNGEKYNPINEVFDEVTKETFGIIIYQEQIMELAQKFGNLSFGQADILRRAISKKKIEEIESMKQIFFLGATQKGYNNDQIQEFFNLIEKFADYGFNKSHAVAYGLLSYRMAYLKTWFPLEFYTTIIQSSIGSQELLKKYIIESRKKNIEIIGPSINESKEKIFSKNNKIFLPFSMVKGIGHIVEKKIILERDQNGKYENFFDVISRLKIIDLSNSTIEILIKANVLREFGNSTTLLNSFSSAEAYTNVITIKKNGEKFLNKNNFTTPFLRHVSLNIEEDIKNEINFLGTQINSFPTKNFETENKISTLKMNETKEITIYLSDFKTLKNKNNEEYAIANVYDSTADIELIIFSKEWQLLKSTPKNLILKAQICFKEFSGKKTYFLVKKWKEI